MLYSTQAMAGTRGNRSAIPRLSPSAMSAICWAAKAASAELKAEKNAPATAVPVRVMVVVVGDLGRFKEVGLMRGFEGLLEVMHLALSMAMVVERVAAIGGCCGGGGGGCC